MTDPQDPLVERPSFGDLLGQLVADGEAFVRAEVELYRAQLGRKAVAARSIVILLLVAMTLAMGAVVASIVGLIFALGPVIGRWWALVVVICGTLALAGALGAWAWSKVGKLLARDEGRE